MKLFWIVAVFGIILASCTANDAEPKKNEGTDEIKEEVKEEKSWLERMKEKYGEKLKAVVDRLKVLAKESIDEAAAAAIKAGKAGFVELIAKSAVEATNGGIGKRSIDLETIENELKEKINEIKERYGQKVKEVLEKLGGLKDFTAKTFKDAALELLAEKAAESTWAILGKREIKEEEKEEVKEEKSWLERMKEKYGEKIKAVVDRLKVLAKESIDEAAAAAIRAGKAGFIELIAKNGVEAVSGGLRKRSSDLENIENQLKEKLNAIKEKYGEKVMNLLKKLEGFKDLAGKAFKDAALELLAEKAAESTWAILGKRGLKDITSKGLNELKSFVDKAKCEYNSLRVYKCILSTVPADCPPEVQAWMKSDKPIPGCK